MMMPRRQLQLVATRRFQHLDRQLPRVYLLDRTLPGLLHLFARLLNANVLAEPSRVKISGPNLRIGLKPVGKNGVINGPPRDGKGKQFTLAVENQILNHVLQVHQRHAGLGSRSIHNTTKNQPVHVGCGIYVCQAPGPRTPRSGHVLSTPEQHITWAVVDVSHLENLTILI